MQRGPGCAIIIIRRRRSTTRGSRRQSNRITNVDAAGNGVREEGVEIVGDEFDVISFNGGHVVIVVVGGPGVVGDVANGEAIEIYGIRADPKRKKDSCRSSHEIPSG